MPQQSNLSPPICRCGLEKWWDAEARQWLCRARYDGKHAGYGPAQAGEHVGIDQVGARDAAAD